MKKRYLILANAAKDKNLVGSLVCEAKGTVATFKIRGYIGSEKCNTEVLTGLVDDAIANGAKTAIVYVSSQGGSVYEANDMVYELERFGVDNVTIQVGALAASAATRFLTSFKSIARPNSQFMIHKPSSWSGGNEKEQEASLKELKNVTNEYRAAYAKKMGKTEDEIEAMWADGDKWLNAKEAKAYKLIDKIEGPAENIDEETKAMLVACGAPQPKPTAPKAKITYMERDELIAALGLEATATDDQIKAALAAKKQATQSNTMDRLKLIASLGLDATATDEQIDTAVKKMRASATAHDAAQKDAESQLKTTAETDVKAAITAKKIPATQLEAFVKMYMAAPAETKAALEALPAGKALSAELDPANNGNVEAARKDWKLEDYIEKDPKALTAMEKTDPTRFKKLNDDYYGNI